MSQKWFIEELPLLKTEENLEIYLRSIIFEIPTKTFYAAKFWSNFVIS